ncbi:hypothetical protein HYC85_016266 [Camellia sinensis]|uniref:DNA topoisomerase (ATP-hydrolyzing) n=1 Tax=Camellia sinensis TaxID=4442 RepID=A0A7J7H2U4_CAMSI|nr:hypothetical protein HYC85_016266 [Camellia sinensis]
MAKVNFAAKNFSFSSTPFKAVMREKATIPHGEDYQAQNCISVYNNGDGVPVEIHQEEGVYVLEMIFGHLLTSSNYDDLTKKTTGGRNGYGAKLTNIFSTEFVIETAEGKRQKKYKQVSVRVLLLVFSNNMGKKSKLVITKCKESENWTKVTFKPDLAKFNMTHLEDDVVALIKKRVIDLAGCLGKTVKVELNGQRIPVKSFLDYVNLYLQSASKARLDALPSNLRWNKLQDVIPPEIGELKSLTHLYLNNNYLTDGIPAQLANLTNLEILPEHHRKSSTSPRD